jgi:lycopene beta-cyclase
VVIDADASLGGNHTWSFHDSDLDSAGAALVADLVVHRWPRYEVRFPGHERTLEGGYATVSSDELARVLGRRLADAGVSLLLGQRVAQIGATSVRLADETVLSGDLVIDARGPVPSAAREPFRAGYQKFVGLEVELTRDGPWSVPLLMDATVPQHDGFRFMYVLPFSARRVLIEDTRYSDTPDLDRETCERAILGYATRNGASVARVLRREEGALPLPLGVARAWPHVAPDVEERAAREQPLQIGYRGGFFHAVTGYSLAQATRVALAVASANTPEDARKAVARIARSLAPQHRLGRLLNRLMFDALPDESRWRAFARFYRLPERTIARFYASQSTWTDQARVLVGRPPAGIRWSRVLGARPSPPQTEIS